MFARRFAATVAVLAFGAAAVVLLLADRVAPIFSDAVNVVIRTGRLVEQESGVNVIDRDDIPGEADQIGHAIFWGTGMLLVGFVLRRRVPLLLTALVMAVLSLNFELAQPLLSTTRAVELSDAVANVLGIAGATVVLGPILWAMRRFFDDERPAIYEVERLDPIDDDFAFRDDPTDELFLPLNGR